MDLEAFLFSYDGIPPEVSGSFSLIAPAGISEVILLLKTLG